MTTRAKAGAFDQPGVRPRKIAHRRHIGGARRTSEAGMGRHDHVVIGGKAAPRTRRPRPGRPAVQQQHRPAEPLCSTLTPPRPPPGDPRLHAIGVSFGSILTLLSYISILI